MKYDFNGAQEYHFNPADLVKFTEEILNGKLHFLCSELTRRWLVFKNFPRKVSIKIFQNISSMNDSLTILVYSEIPSPRKDLYMQRGSNLKKNFLCIKSTQCFITISVKTFHEKSFHSIYGNLLKDITMIMFIIFNYFHYHCNVF